MVLLERPEPATDWAREASVKPLTALVLIEISTSSRAVTCPWAFKVTLADLLEEPFCVVGTAGLKSVKASVTV